MNLTKKDVGKIVINNDNDELSIVKYAWDDSEDDFVFLVMFLQYDKDPLNSAYWVNSKGKAFELFHNYSLRGFKQ